MKREASPSEILKDSTKNRNNHTKRDSQDDLKNTVIVRNEKELLNQEERGWNQGYLRDTNSSWMRSMNWSKNL